MRGQRAEASRGLADARRAHEYAEAAADDASGPRYADGSAYRIGDVLPEGTVRYARRIGSAVKDPEQWRLVVIDPAGGPSRTIRPSTTAPITRGGTS